MDTASDNTVPEISVNALLSLLGSSAAPRVLDVRRPPAYEADARTLPAALRCEPAEVAQSALALFGPPDLAPPIITCCVYGHEVGRDAAAVLRAQGYDARHLAGGIEDWKKIGAPTMQKRIDLAIPSATPSRWITRARPKIDRIACPWLVRRFIDPRAEFLYVPADQVLAEAKRTGAIAYDIPGATFSHVGEHCSFDAVLVQFAIVDPALDALAKIVRGADTGKPDLTPQSPGLLAVSLGLSVNFPDDHEMLEHGMVIYDALYAWLRSAHAEVHNADLFAKPAA